MGWIKRLVTGQVGRTPRHNQEEEPKTPDLEETKPSSLACSSPVPPEPRVIARSDHAISRQRISFNALKVMGRLIRSGYKAYLVGGCIRDLMIGKKPKDFDVVTDAGPDEVHRLFRNSRQIGRRFRLVHVFFKGGEIIEVSTFRKGIPFDPDHDEPLREENTFGTPAEDAWRRDLTINGLFYDLETFAIYDYVGGFQDLLEKKVRVIGDPKTRFHEDPVRMLRAIRHAAGTGFAIEPTTGEAIRECAEEITKANSSRLRDEFLRELTEGRAHPSIKLMMEYGLLGQLIPSTREIFRPGNGASAATEHLLANLSALDEAIHRHKDLPLPVTFAVFLSPMIAAKANAAPDAPDQSEQPAPSRLQLTKTYRQFLKSILAEMKIGQGNGEAVTMMLLGQTNLRQAMEKDGRLPKLLTRKSYFDPSLLLYQIEARGRKEWLPKPIFNAARDRELLLFAKVHKRPAAAEPAAQTEIITPRKPRRRRPNRRTGRIAADRDIDIRQTASPDHFSSPAGQNGGENGAP